MTIQAFGKYQLLQKLATGGMAEVWLARDGGDRLLVVKRILPHLVDSPEFVQMFLNEARIAARFNHPNIAQIFDLGQHERSYYIALEYVHGEDLGRVMSKSWSTGQWMPKALAIRIVADACEGLHYAHTKTDETGRPLKVVHRDVSPQNILVGFDGQVKLVDFGIAKAAGQAPLTRTGSLKGKFAYMSPEQAAGKQVDQRADVFSLALVLYELVTGMRPLKRESELGTLQAALEGAIPPASETADVGPELDAILSRALAKHPEHRFPDAQSFGSALADLLRRKSWDATSGHIAELMAVLFPDRVDEKRRFNLPEEVIEDLSPIITGSLLAEPAATAPSDSMAWDAPTGKEVEENTEQSLPRPSGSALPAWSAAPATELEAQHGRSAPGDPASAQALFAEDLPPLTATRVPRPSSERIHHSSQPGFRLGRHPPVTADDEIPTASGASAREDTIPNPPPRRTTGRKPRTRASPLKLGHYVDPHPEALRDRRWVKRLVGALFLGAAVAFGVVYGEAILSALQRRPIDGKGVLLTVDSSPKAKVYVRHGKAEGASVELELLGETPLRREKGAHILDTLILSNPEVGLYYEEELRFGYPDGELKLEKRFGKGSFLLSVTPEQPKGLSVWRGEQEVGRYSPGLRIELYEGKHRLELRGAQLKTPHPFEVEIRPGETYEQAIDLAGRL